MYPTVLLGFFEVVIILLSEKFAFAFCLCQLPALNMTLSPGFFLL